MLNDFTTAHKHPPKTSMYTTKPLRTSKRLPKHADVKCMLRGGVTPYVIGGRVCVSGNLLLVSPHTHRRSQTDGLAAETAAGKRNSPPPPPAPAAVHKPATCRGSEVEAMLNTKCYRLVWEDNEQRGRDLTKSGWTVTAAGEINWRDFWTARGERRRNIGK